MLSERPGEVSIQRSNWIRVFVACFLMFIASATTGQEPDRDTLMQRGESRLERGDPVGAIADFTEVIRLDPKHSKAWLLRGKAKLTLKYNHYAHADFTQAIQLDPANADAIAERGWMRVYNNVGDHDESIADLDKAIAAGIRLADSYSARGLAKYYQGDFVAAVEDCNASIDLAGLKQANFHNRGLCRMGLGDIQGAFEDFDRDIMGNASFAQNYLYRGMLHQVLGNGEKAKADFDKYLSLNPNRESEVANYTELAQILVAEPQPETADEFVARAIKARTLGFDNECVADCTRALNVNPDHVKGLVARADALYRLAYYSSAIKDYDRATSLEPANADYQYKRGLTHYMRMDYQAGLADCDKALELEPRYFDALNLRGTILCALERFDEASKSYGQCITLNPAADEVAHDNHAFSLKMLGDYGRAKQLVDKALAIKPAYLDALIHSAQIRTALGDTDGALKVLDQASELAPADFWPVVVRVEVLMARGEFEEALAAADRTLEMSPNYSEAYRLRGLVKELQGDLPAAIAELDTALMWDAHSDACLLARGLLLGKQGDSAASQADLDAAVQIKPPIKARLDAILARTGVSSVAAICCPIISASKTVSGKSSATLTGAPETETKVNVPKLAQTAFDKAMLLYESGELDQANAEFRRAITFFPRFGKAYLYRGLIHLKKGEKQEAERAFAECLRFEPNLKETVGKERAKIENDK